MLAHNPGVTALATMASISPTGEDYPLLTDHFPVIPHIGPLSELAQSVRFSSRTRNVERSHQVAISPLNPRKIAGSALRQTGLRIGHDRTSLSDTEEKP